MSKLELDVWSGGRSDEAAIITDKYGRFRMSSGLIKMLSAAGVELRLFVAFDKANKRIALGKPGVVNPTDSKPVNFDKQRHYTNVAAFMKKHGLPLERVKYVFDGRIDGWMLFKREGYAAPDGRGTS